MQKTVGILLKIENQQRVAEGLQMIEPVRNIHQISRAHRGKKLPSLYLQFQRTFSLTPEYCVKRGTMSAKAHICFARWHVAGAL